MESAIERIERPTYDQFRRHFLSRRQPLLIDGAIEHWPAMRLWSFDYVERALGDRHITPIILNRGNLYLDLQDGLRVEEMDFPRYRSQIEDGDAPAYYLRLALQGPFADLMGGDYETPIYCRHRILLKKNLWVGGKGAASSLHYDMTHNLIAQVVGRRRVMLFAPKDTEKLYPYPLRTLSWHHSQVRLEAPDLVRFPRFAEAQRIEFDIIAGEMLFIPQGWWHSFTTLQPAVAVNFFWLTKRLAPALALARMAWVLKGVRT